MLGKTSKLIFVFLGEALNISWWSTWPSDKNVREVIKKRMDEEKNEIKERKFFFKKRANKNLE